MGATADRAFGNIPTVPASSHVSERTKQRITQGKYFDIKKLLPTLEEVDDFDQHKKLTFQQWSRFEDQHRAPKKPEKNLTFFDWVRCYHTLMSLRLQVYPSELQGMLRHAEIVQDLHNQGKDAIRYDALFRRAREQHPSIRWGEYMSEIVNNLPARWQAQGPSRAPVFSRQQPWTNNFGPNISRGSQGDRRICGRFNSLNGCQLPVCTFAHKCRVCGRAGHPAHRCFSRRPPTGRY